MFAKLMVSHHQILFSLAIAAIAEAILMQTSAEQVPSLFQYLSKRLTYKFTPELLINTTENRFPIDFFIDSVLLCHHNKMHFELFWDSQDADNSVHPYAVPVLPSLSLCSYVHKFTNRSV